MSRVLLYYPAINIPDNGWLRKALLYSDKVSSIVPFAEMTDGRISKDLKNLYGEGFYQPISVFDGIESSEPHVEEFEQNVIDTLSSKEFKAILTKSSVGGNSAEIEDHEIYLTKITHKVETFLKEEKLLKDFKNGRVEVEKNCAIVYMSMLSDFLAKGSKDLVTPSTDEPEYERLAYQLNDNKQLTYKIEFQNLLPAPAPDVDLYKLIDFKKKRKDELLRFRTILDQAEKDILSCSTDDERKLKMEQFSERIEIEINDIRKIMGDSKLNYYLSGFSSLLDVKQKEIFGTIGSLGVVSAGAIAAFPLIGLGAGALVLTGTLVSAFSKMNNDASAHACSYLFYAQKTGIVSGN